MSSLLKYRIKCSIEDAWKHWWLRDDEPPPTTCPTDTTHAVEAASVAVVDRRATTEVNVAPKVGGLDTVMDGGVAYFSNNEWAWVEWTLDEDLHLTGALVSWSGWKEGDYGFACIANPAAQWALTAQAASGQNEIPMTGAPGTLLGAYDPANVGGPVWVELWSASGGSRVDLVERSEVDTVDYVNGKLVMKSNLVETHAAGAILVPEVGLFTNPRGSHLIDGGIFLVGSGHEHLGSIMRTEATEKISAGLCMCLRIYGAGAGTQRAVGCTFFMRRPEP